MPNPSATRFRFIGHALEGTGPFRPVVTPTGSGTALSFNGETALVRYPREGEQKFARRNEIAFYASPVARLCSRFAGYIGAKPPTRDLGHDLFRRMAQDIDGKGNALDVWLASFMVQAKARGSMLLQVDMAQQTAPTLAQQLAMRRVPYWMAIAPEQVTDCRLGDDGRFDFVEYEGEFDKPDGERVPCTWRFDRQAWAAFDREKKPLGGEPHPLGECPVLIFTEQGDFPCFGPFAALADLSRRLFNAESELDEILRGQTFSLMHLQVPDGSTDEQKLAAAKVAGETVGTANLLVHTGSTPPGFIAPPDGPAKIYLDRVTQLRGEIAEVGLDVATIGQQESGLAMRMRFAAINAELAKFAGRMEDLERRAWDLSRRWLAMQSAPTVQWPRDYQLADVEQELRVLADMQAAGMPAEVIAEQQRRIVAVQFGGLDTERMDEITRAIDERVMEPARTRTPKEPTA